MLAALVVAAAAPRALPPAPIDFGAATMTLEPKENTTRLEGDVWFDRKDLRVRGDRAVAEFAEAAQAPAQPAKKPAKGKKAKPAKPAPKPEDGQKTLSRFTVEGSVHVERPGQISRTADGQTAVYDAPRSTLVLTGAPSKPPAGLTGATGPVLRDGPELLVGERVLLRLESDEVEVERPRLLLRRSLPGVEDGAAKAASPVRVEAGKLRLDQHRKVARFREKVVIHRGDLTVRSPWMDARYDEAGQLTTLELRGGVQMVDGDRRATGKQADYDAGKRTLVLTGDPRLIDRGDVLRGSRIELQLDSREVRVDKASGRVRPEQHKGEAGVPQQGGAR